jgi:uncharacterized PurR-regulated membrane protein YhhQ (DUF165 family)
MVTSLSTPIYVSPVEQKEPIATNSLLERVEKKVSKVVMAAVFSALIAAFSSATLLISSERGHLHEGGKVLAKVYIVSECIFGASLLAYLALKVSLQIQKAKH